MMEVEHSAQKDRQKCKVGNIVYWTYKEQGGAFQALGQTSNAENEVAEALWVQVYWHINVF